MKYYFAFLLCLVSASIFAQISYQDFIQQDNTIEWAAEYNPIMAITPKVKKFRIRQILLQQQERNGYINSYRITNDSVVKFNFYKGDKSSFTDSSINFETPYGQYFWDDADLFIKEEKKCSCSSNSSSNIIDVYKLKQIIYYKKSKLYTKNILVTPLCLKGLNEWHLFIWQSSFSSCFNNSKSILTAELKKNCVDLGTSEQVYNPMYYNYDPRDINPATNIFTIKNPNLGRHLFEDIFDNKITAVDDSDNIIPIKNILHYKAAYIQIPDFDSIGNISGYRMYEKEFEPDSFYRYKINQHFYFDTINNILYSEVNYIELLRYEFDSTGRALRDAVYCRIYFIKPSLYKKPLKHRFLRD